MWREWRELPQRLQELIAGCSMRIAVTMTGEIADCFSSRKQGVESIVDSVVRMASDRVVFYSTEGTFLDAAEARRNPMRVAAANWHALARLAATFTTRERCLLVDVGSTTTDIIPVVHGTPVSRGLVDQDRLAESELIYTGVARSPLCAIIPSIEFESRIYPLAQELFATTRDAYLVLGHLEADRLDRNTADGQPATAEAARCRLSRMVLAEPDWMTLPRAQRFANEIYEAQIEVVGNAIRRVTNRYDLAERSGEGVDPWTIVTSGQGEFLAQRASERSAVDHEIVSLAKKLSGDLSTCASAFAVATLAAEEALLT